MGLSLERHLDEALAAPRDPVHGFSGRELCDIADITYRQADYWARIDLLRPSIADARGSGSRRRYSEADVEVARVLGDLMALCGRSTDQLAAAVRLVREKRIAPAGEWLAVPLDDEVRRLSGDLPADLASPCYLVRLLPYSRSAA